MAPFPALVSHSLIIGTRSYAPGETVEICPGFKYRVGTRLYRVADTILAPGSADLNDGEQDIGARMVRADATRAATTRDDGLTALGRAVLATEAVATDRGIVLMSGLDLSRFARNPVMPWGHDYGAPPVGLWEDVRVVGKRLEATPLFHELTEHARDVKALYAAGIMRAYSIGFIPVEISLDLTSAETKAGGVWKAVRTLILEASAVTVGADGGALQKSRATDVEKALTEAIEASAEAAAASPATTSEEARGITETREAATPPSPTPGSTAEGTVTSEAAEPGPGTTDASAARQDVELARLISVQRAIAELYRR